VELVVELVLLVLLDLLVRTLQSLVLLGPDLLVYCGPVGDYVISLNGETGAVSLSPGFEYVFDSDAGATPASGKFDTYNLLANFLSIHETTNDGIDIGSLLLELKLRGGDMTILKGDGTELLMVRDVKYFAESSSVVTLQMSDNASFPTPNSDPVEVIDTSLTDGDIVYFKFDFYPLNFVKTFNGKTGDIVLDDYVSSINGYTGGITLTAANNVELESSPSGITIDSPLNEYILGFNLDGQGTTLTSGQYHNFIRPIEISGTVYEIGVRSPSGSASLTRGRLRYISSNYLGASGASLEADSSTTGYVQVNTPSDGVEGKTGSLNLSLNKDDLVWPELLGSGYKDKYQIYIRYRG
jgi:hypothetical protein